MLQVLPHQGAVLICEMLLHDDPAHGPLRALLQSLNMVRACPRHYLR